MKFLHTADWHLGVKTNGRDRLAEQKKALEEIISISNYEGIDCVIIAGDIFNTASPSADAEELFFDTIEKLSDGGDRFVLVLAGNHDDPTRIEAGLPLASKHNIALVGDLKALNEKSFVKGGLVEVVETGKGYVKIQKGLETAVIAYLPYPSESRISEKCDDGLSYNEKIKVWAEMGAGAFSSDSVNIFVSHLFLVGSKTRSGEVKVGDSLAVPASVLPKANYVALGHLHTPQSPAKNVYYSGAITSLTVGQSGFGVNVFMSENGKIENVKTIKLQNIAKYESVTVSSLSEAEERLLDYDDSDIIELIVRQSEPLSSSALKALKKKFACISSVALKRETDEQDDQEFSRGRKLLSDTELFKNFYKSVRGYDASEELISMFNSVKGEEDETD